MLGVLVTYVLDSEVINNKGECDVAGMMLPQRRRAGDGGVAVTGKVVLEALVGKIPCLLEPGNPLPDFHIDISVLGEELKVVLVDNFFGHHGNW